MSSFFSSLQSYVRPLATVAAGVIIAKIMSTNSTSPDGGAGLSDGDKPNQPGQYKPSPIDVIVVRVTLERAFNLPPELLDLIIDQAEYWPHSEASLVYQVQTARDALRIVGGTAEGENKLLVRCPPIGYVDYKKVGEAFKTAPLPPKSADGSVATEPLRNLTLMEPSSSPTEPTREAPREYFTGSMTQPPALIHPVRKIVFKFRSRDQGWGGSYDDQGTYHGSWTWFEAGLEKFDKDRKCATVHVSNPRRNNPLIPNPPIPQIPIPPTPIPKQRTCALAASNRYILPSLRHPMGSWHITTT
nr:uncharacterized protein CTRU02_01156 [Colletotrichum truncatum]KAF6800751.1 hypothetical protein CTRU02_01156 [Colletotrichum truncatum]